VPAATTFVVNGRVLCTPCADKTVIEIQKAKGALEVLRGNDPTICFKCAADFGSTELPLSAGMHACENCRNQMLNFEYSAWLKIAFAALLLLLGVALVHGRSYFAAGRSYYRAKKLLESGHPLEAVLHFQKALESGTTSADVLQNTALAYLRAGMPEEAYKLVEGRTFEKTELFRSVEAEFNRWVQASEKANNAAQLYKEKKYREAAKSMHEAAAAYPELPSLADSADRLDYTVLFDAGDYDGLVNLSEKLWARNHTYESAAGLAGAYACRYAVTGDDEIKRKATHMMDSARSLAKSKDDQDDLSEWQPRFDHRIQTRRILTREQYYSLFPQEPEKEAKN
jgi:tetratricopeptide (TPR) repeat protein